MNTTIGSTSLPGSTSSASLLSRLNQSDASNSPAKKGDLKVREKFQDFAAGTFYKEMLKALRQGQKNSKYFYGGQAEEIFRGQMDQQVAEDLAHQNGAAFAGPLFDAYARQAELGSAAGSSLASSSPVSSTGQVHAFDAIA